jgi:hypothetical protein
MRYGVLSEPVIRAEYTPERTLAMAKLADGLEQLQATGVSPVACSAYQ